jgi:DNA-binding FadR family transcriptional regulator
MNKTKAPPKVKKSEMVVAKLRDYIIDHQLRPGDRLPTEDQLAVLFRVSRVSIREATKALGFLGIIEASPRRGLSVGRVSMERVSKYLGFHLATSNLSVQELVATRIVIETGGLARVSERMAEDWIIYEKLHQLNDRLRRAKSTREWIESDVEFHCHLVSSSGLRTLTAFNDLLQVFFQRLRKDFPRSEWRTGVNQHQQIIDALRERDPDTAAHLLRAHIESHLERLTSDKPLVTPILHRA